MTKISVQEMLANIRSTQRVFELTFIRATGKKQGTIKTVMCRAGAPKNSVAAPKGSTTKSFARKAQLPLTDVNVNGNNLITPLISHIIGFNNLKVIH